MATAKLLLDKSITNKNGQHPVRIQVYHAGRQDKFTTKIATTDKLFTTPNRNVQKQLDAVRQKAEAICERLGGGYTKEKFKRMFYSEIDYTTRGQRLDLKDLYTDYMTLLEANHHSPKTVSYHKSAMKCFTTYHPNITLQEVTMEWLNSFEKYMLNRGKTLTAVGTYVRSLRTIYNKAIEDGLIGRETFPFGKRKYAIAAAVSAKSFLTPQEIQRFKDYVPQNDAQQRAKDFWFFCYYLNGIAPVDAVQLTVNNIRSSNIIFHRQKTAKSKAEAKPIVAHIHDEVKIILQRQGYMHPKHYLFPILRPGMTPTEKVEAIDTWKRLTNRVLNRISIRLKFHIKANLYSARHSWATVMKLNDVSIHDISDGLGHSRIIQTQNYLGSIITDKVKTLSDFL